MEQIAPYTEMFMVPPGTILTVYAADQAHLGYEPLPCIKTPDGKVVSQWKPTDKEIEQLRAGVPLTLIIHTFNRPLQPISLGVGGFDLT
jgi:hypothetical protein